MTSDVIDFFYLTAAYNTCGEPSVFSLPCGLAAFLSVIYIMRLTARRGGQVGQVGYKVSIDCRQ
jgi:hypothetical protein